MQTSGHEDDILYPNDLKILAEMRGGQAPVFSLYLDLRPERGLLGRFEQLLSQAADQKKLDNQPPEYRQQWQAEADRIRRWLEDGQSNEGQGMAIFSSQPGGLWRVFRLPAPVTDRLVVKDQPYLRPLEILMHEFECSLVILADGGLARLVEVFFGRAAEVDRIEAVPVTGAAFDEDMAQFARAVADRAEAVWKAHDCARLVVGGGGLLLETLRSELSAEMRAKLIEDLDLSPDAGLDEILTHVREIEQDAEQRLEAGRVAELLETAAGTSSAGAGSGSAGGAPGVAGQAVLGIEQTLLAVRGQKARLVIVDEDYHPAGGECPNDGFMDEGDQDVCLLCGMALRPEPDIVEVALKRALEQSGEIEVLRSPESAGALKPHGHIGALLYNTAAGQDHRTGRGQTKRDETVDESFPASDPPGY